MLSIFGHIHEARGVERVWWNDAPPENRCLVKDVEAWKDPGAGSNKQSLVNLAAKGGRPLGNCSRLTRQSNIPEFLIRGVDPCGGRPDEPGVPQPGAGGLNSTSRREGVAYSEATGRAMAMLGGAIEYRQVAASSDIGLADKPDVEDVERRETVMINAALLGPRIAGGPKWFNKPIVVDVDLPVWSGSFEKNAA